MCGWLPCLSARHGVAARAPLAGRHGGLRRATARGLERALRLAPQDARVYFSLAQIRYQQGQKNQAKSLAQKARALVVDDSALLASIVQFQKVFASRY